MLVTGKTANTLTAVLNAATNHMEVQLGGAPLSFTSGRFQGFVESYAKVDGARTDLNSLASTLINEVNTLHNTGFDLRGNPAGDFFSGTDAASLDVTAAIQADSAQIAASTTNAPGGNDLALAIAQLRSKDVLPLGTPVATLNQTFDNFILGLGSDSRRAQQTRQGYADAVQAVTEQRQAVSGVNMDEELTNLVAFQRAYEASARVVTTADEMLDQIINKMGIVGR
jgi:flagellar hook-associated protein 1